MNYLIEELVKDNLITKSNVRDFILKNPKRQVRIGALLSQNYIEKSQFYQYILQKLRVGDLSFDSIDALSKEDVNSVELYEFIAQNLNIEYIDLQNIEIDSSLLDKIPTSILLKNRIVITEEDD
ncbi:MAG TPA: hypothetical protein ENL00_00810, partial [Nitratifractor sp.]|nr:hypothetical protein [Nitratifractor sp.]